MGDINEWNEWNRKVIEEFRDNEGKVRDFDDVTLLLLHTTGAKSGLPRVNPLTFMIDGDNYVVLASKRGASNHPDWYYNLVADPEVHIEVGTEKFEALATVVGEPERTALYAKMSELYPFIIELHQKTTRVIPVISLSRITK